MVNRLKIPQGLSTPLFHRWSEVPSRGGVRGDSPYEKLPALQRCHLCMFSKCCFQSFLLDLLLSELFFLVVWLFCLAFCKLCSSQNGFHRAPFEFDWFILGLFLLALFYLAIIFMFCPAFYEAPLILNASLGGEGDGGCHTPSCT